MNSQETLLQPQPNSTHQCATTDQVVRHAHTYNNPVTYDDGRVHTAPDPFVLQYRGTYYCYATDAQGVTVSTSQDLVHWHYYGYCYQETGRQQYWAPSVLLINDQFVMAVSNMPDDTDDVHQQIMRIAVSDSPLGMFSKQHELFDTFAIDSQLIYGDDNQLYLLYADNQVAGLNALRPGTSLMIDRLDETFHREGKPRALAIPDRDEEIFAKNRFGDGRDWHTIEGATVFTYHNHAYLTYSANAYEHENYHVGYLCATLPSKRAARALDQLAWYKHDRYRSHDPLLQRNEDVEGTGHNSIVLGPNGIQPWIIYHGRNAHDELILGTEQRVMRIDPLLFAEDALDTLGPTSGEQYAPYTANITDLPYERQNHDARAIRAITKQVSVSGDADNNSAPHRESNSSWEILKGSATLENDHCSVVLTSGNEPFTAIRAFNSSCLRMSVWAKGNTNPLGTRFGFIVRYTDRDNYTQIIIDAGTQSVILQDCTNGLIQEQLDSLAPNINAYCWHEYSVQKTYNEYMLYIDSRECAHWYASQEQSSCVSNYIGLCAQSTTQFAALRVSEHYNLWGNTLTYIRNIAHMHNMEVHPSLETRDSRSYRECDSTMPSIVALPQQEGVVELDKTLNNSETVFDFVYQLPQAHIEITFGDITLKLSGLDNCETYQTVQDLRKAEKHTEIVAEDIANASKTGHKAVLLRNQHTGQGNMQQGNMPIIVQPIQHNPKQYQQIYRDEQGRELHTIRIVHHQDAYEIHMRGITWRIQANNQPQYARITLQNAGIRAISRTTIRY